MHKILTKTKGFTLIELLLVVSIISLLSSIIIVTLSDARVKAFDTIRISDMHQIKNAVELYYIQHGYYPQVSGGSSEANIPLTEEECATRPNPKPGWCQLRTMLAPYLDLPSPPLYHGEEIPITYGGITYWHQVRYIYRTSVSDGFQKYGVMTTLHAPGNLAIMANDGGVYNIPTSNVQPFYEVGNLPQYCRSKYSGDDAAWTGFSAETLCWGGN